MWQILSLQLEVALNIVTDLETYDFENIFVAGKSISTLSLREDVKEQLFQRTQEEDTEGEKT